MPPRSSGPPPFGRRKLANRVTRTSGSSPAACRLTSLSCPASPALLRQQEPSLPSRPDSKYSLRSPRSCDQSALRQHIQRVECRAVGRVDGDGLEDRRTALALLGVTNDAVVDPRRSADPRSQRFAPEREAHKGFREALAAGVLSVWFNLQDLPHVVLKPLRDPPIHIDRTGHSPAFDIFDWNLVLGTVSIMKEGFCVDGISEQGVVFAGGLFAQESGVLLVERYCQKV